MLCSTPRPGFQENLFNEDHWSHLHKGHLFQYAFHQRNHTSLILTKHSYLSHVTSLILDQNIEQKSIAFLQQPKRIFNNEIFLFYNIQTSNETPFKKIDGFKLFLFHRFSCSYLS
eukprot:TRINITY_DN4342_c0_g1_i1.p1 TRINITY_DN4342_c0_g1~~TRINITY_DN4342_c0_g1_i1.p1  ORF type:complete len:115 (-),score=6.32 TRINITY_DN4342_c0_g1_i1:15-359(-)